MRVSLKPDEMVCINPKCKKVVHTNHIIPICDYCTENLTCRDYNRLIEEYKK